MRSGEIILLILSLFYIVVKNKNWKESYKSILITITFCCIILNVICEGFLWQMTFIYLAVFILFLMQISNAKINRRFTIISYLLLSLIFLGSVGLLLLFPLTDWAKPIGTYGVGVRNILLVDSNRIEKFDTKESFRKIPCNVWYPADIELNVEERDPYFNDPFTESAVWAKGHGFSFIPFIWSHLGLLKTNHVTNAKISSKKNKYPLLIFSHGYWQSNSFNQYILENLASCGFIVLSITHEYESSYTFYPGKKINIYSKENSEFQKRSHEYNNAQVGNIIKELNETGNPNVKNEQLTKLNDKMPGWYESNITWAEDISFCIKELARINGDPFFNKIDTCKIGVLGFSFGGGASGLASMNDKRIKACINIDGFQTVFNKHSRLLCPTLFIYSEEHTASNSYFYKLTNQPVYELTIKGTKHSNFSDIAFHAELLGKRLGYLGSKDSKESSKILVENVILFFAKSLDIYEGFITGDSSLKLKTAYKIVQ